MTWISEDPVRHGRRVEPVPIEQVEEPRDRLVLIELDLRLFREKD